MGQEFWLGAATGAVILAVLVAVMLFVMGKGRAGLGLKCLSRVMADPQYADKVKALLTPVVETPKPTRPSGVPLRMLTLLQREGRLLDFLMEDISGAPDAQVGYGVREMHQKCQAAVKKALDLEPVLPNNENESVEVPAGFDPSAIRLTGNVAGQPPFRGTLIHPGWRVRQMRLSAPPEGSDDLVLAAAEVEIP
jgi:hypothetical protein